MEREHINLKVQAIEGDLELLRNKHVHELEKAPGTPKCSTLADRMHTLVPTLALCVRIVVSEAE